jgi:hypothetical protein
MSMGCGNISELRPPAGLLLIVPGDRPIGAWRAMILTGENRRTKRNRKQSQCQFAHRKSHMNWPGREPDSLRWDADVWTPEPRHGFSSVTNDAASVTYVNCWVQYRDKWYLGVCLEEGGTKVFEFSYPLGENHLNSETWHSGQPVILPGFE